MAKTYRCSALRYGLSATEWSRRAVERKSSGGTCCAPFPQTTVSDSVDPSLLQRAAPPPQTCHPDRSAAERRDLLCAFPLNNCQRLCPSLSPQAEVRHHIKLCHPDRSAAKWRDLLCCLSLKQLPGTLSIPLCYSRGAPPPQTCHPDRSAAERRDLLCAFPSNNCQRLCPSLSAQAEVRHHLKLVIPTGTQRSGGTRCVSFPQTTASDSVHPSLLPLSCATASNVVIPSSGFPATRRATREPSRPASADQLNLTNKSGRSRLQMIHILWFEAPPVTRPEQFVIR